MPRQNRMYGWIERAHAEGVRFPFGDYNGRIPQDLVEQAIHHSPDVDLPAPWSERFRPASEDDLLALWSDAE